MVTDGDELKTGLYELLITRGIERRIATRDNGLIKREALHRAEAPDRIALHLSRQIERAVAAVPERERVERGTVIARSLIAQLERLMADLDLDDEVVVEPGEVLRWITRRQPDGTPRPIHSPLIPLLDTTLLTNAPGEPRVGHQIAAEVGSAETIDLLMAFIR